MSSFLDRWRQYNRDVYRAGMISEQNNPGQNWFASLREFYKSDVVRDYIDGERFRDTDPWHRKVGHRRAVGLSTRFAGWLANFAEGILKIVEWTLVISLFRYLSAATSHPAFDLIATVLFVALGLYLARYLIPFLLIEVKTRTWTSAGIATLIFTTAIVIGALAFASIGELASIVAANQDIL